MEIAGLILAIVLTLGAVFFFTSLTYSIRGKAKQAKFMAQGLLCLAVSGGILLNSVACGYISFERINDLAVSTLVFVVLSALFHVAYKLKSKEEEKNT